MYKIFTTFSLFSVLLVSSCTPEEPAAEPTGAFNFSATNNDLRAPAEITFTPSDEMEGATFIWDFGDGSTTTEKVPKKVFTTGGTKTVKLTVLFNGKSISDSKTLTVDAPYTKLAITKSTILTAATAFSDGTGWDLLTNVTNWWTSGGPDVYLIGRYENMTTDAYYTNIKQNVSASALVSGSTFWDHGSGFTISSNVQAAGKLFIQLRDADENANLYGSYYESMGTVVLNPSDYVNISNKYPSSIELKGNGTNYSNAALKMKFDLKWSN